MRRLVLVHALLVLCSTAAIGQDAGGFTRYGAAEGLYSLALTRLVEDARGLLWLGTEDGLVRYDGTRFRTFLRDDEGPHGLADDLVRAFDDDGKGGLWVWTSAGGLQHFDARTEAFLRVPVAGLDPASLYAWTLVRHGERLYLGTEEGIYRIDPGEGASVRLAPGPMMTVAVGVDGTVWAGGDGGLVRMAQGGASGATIPVPGGMAPRALLAVGPRLYVGVAEGVVEMAPGVPARVHLQGQTVNALAQGPDGAIWAGGAAGLWRLPPAGGPPVHYPSIAEHPGTLPSPQVRTLRVDRAGTLWVGTNAGLAARRVHQPFALVPGPGGVERPGVKNVTVDAAGVVWMGGISSGLCAARPSDRPACARRVPGPLVHGVVWATEQAPGGMRYVAAWEDGLLCLPQGAMRMHPCAGLPSALRHPRDVAVGDDGALWVATGDSGVFRLQAGRWEQVPARRTAVPGPDTTHAFAMALLPDAGGVVWVGTTGGGLYRIGPGRRVRRYGPGPGGGGFPADRIVTLARTPDGAVWAGTMHRGVVRLDPATGAVRRYGAAEGLPAPSVLSLVVDARGRLWAFSAAGASRFNGSRFVTYGPQEGFPDSKPYWHAAGVDLDGRIYVGMAGGALVFHPDRLGAASLPPAPHVMEVRLSGEPVLPAMRAQGRWRLAYDENVVSLELGGADAGPGRSWTYAVRHVGPGQTEGGAFRVSEAGQLNLGALAPGRHTVTVWAETAGRAGPARTLGFDVAAPWWATWWFRGALLVVLGGLAYGAHRLRMARILEVERTRRQIADDLHDDVGSRISSVALLLDLLSQTAEADARTRLELGGLAERTRRMVDDLRDNIWAIDAQRDRLTDLVRRLEKTAQQQLAGLAWTFDTPTPLPDLPVPMRTRRTVLLVCKEALHNARRHSGATHVVVAVALEGDAWLRLRVRDDGCGYNGTWEGDGGSGRGLASMANRAREAGGEVEVASEVGRGTMVTLRVPLRERPAGGLGLKAFGLNSGIPLLAGRRARRSVGRLLS